MASGLLALFDDVAAFAKIASASLDDVVKMSAKAAGKSILPLLILGGAYLCYEGYGKMRELFVADSSEKTAKPLQAIESEALEREKIASAIRTDFILSAEIMAITLSTVGEASLAMKAIVLAVVGMGITIAVYGTVALIVKADDFGVALAKRNRPWSAIGRGVVHTMPLVLSSLSLIGTLAMLWVGGGIILHSLAEYGLSGPEYWIKDVGASAGSMMPIGGRMVAWVVGAALAGMAGLAIGAAVAPLSKHVIRPLWQRLLKLRCFDFYRSRTQ